MVQDLLHGYMSPPETEEQWKNIAQEFGYLWHFPHVVGAIDGKHMVIEAPAKPVCIIIIKGRLVFIILVICDLIILHKWDDGMALK